jgi:hypothetical protein
MKLMPQRGKEKEHQATQRSEERAEKTQSFTRA